MSGNCENFREMMFDFIESEGSDDFSELKKHLEECPSCRAELEECKKLISAVEVCAPSPERDIKNDVMLIISADAKLRRRRRLVRGLSAIAAAVALFVGVGIAFSGGLRGFDAVPPNMEGDAMDFEDGNSSINDAINDASQDNDAYLPDDIYEIIGSFEESIAVIELCGNDAERLYELLSDEFSLDESEKDFLSADINQKDAITARIKELSVDMDAYFSEYSDSDAPEIVIVIVK